MPSFPFAQEINHFVLEKLEGFPSSSNRIRIDYFKPEEGKTEADPLSRFAVVIFLAKQRAKMALGPEILAENGPRAIT